LLRIVAAFWVAGRESIRFEPRKLAYSVALFMLLGATGEAFANSMWNIVFGWPVWE
jgi:hypothetical protein